MVAAYIRYVRINNWCQYKTLFSAFTSHHNVALDKVPYKDVLYFGYLFTRNISTCKFNKIAHLVLRKICHGQKMVMINELSIVAISEYFIGNLRVLQKGW